MKQNVNDVLKFRQRREEGAYEKAVEVAKNLLNMSSLSVRQISETTKLSVFEIEEIRVKSNKNWRKLTWTKNCILKF